MSDTSPYTQRLIDPAERAYLADLLDRYEASLKPAEPSEVRRMIGRLTLGYPGAKVSDTEAEERLDLYVAALKDVPADVLGSACMGAVQRYKFFPSISEIREGCGEMLTRHWRASRIRHLIAIHDRDWREPEAEEPLTAEQKVELAEVFRKLGIKLESPA